MKKNPKMHLFSTNKKKFRNLTSITCPTYQLLSFQEKKRKSNPEQKTNMKKEKKNLRSYKENEKKNPQRMKLLMMVTKLNWIPQIQFTSRLFFAILSSLSSRALSLSLVNHHRVYLITNGDKWNHSPILAYCVTQLSRIKNGNNCNPVYHKHTHTRSCTWKSQHTRETFFYFIFFFEIHASKLIIIMTDFCARYFNQKWHVLNWMKKKFFPLERYFRVHMRCATLNFS